MRDTDKKQAYSDHESEAGVHQQLSQKIASDTPSDIVDRFRGNI
jgi:hypothetical protein